MQPQIRLSICLLFLSVGLVACGNTLTKSQGSIIRSEIRIENNNDENTFDDTLPPLIDPDKMGLNALFSLFSNGFENDLTVGWSFVRDDGTAPLGDLSSIALASSIAQGVIDGTQALKSFTDDKDPDNGDPNNGAEASVIVNFDPNQPDATIYAQANYLFKDGFPCTVAQGETTYTDYLSVLKLSKNDSSENLLSISVDGLCRPYVWNSIAGEAYTVNNVFLTTGANAKWHKLKIMGTISPTSGAVKVFLDGVMIIQKTNIDTGNINASRFVFGIGWQGKKDVSKMLYVDQVIIDNKDITL